MYHLSQSAHLWIIAMDTIVTNIVAKQIGIAGKVVALV